MGVLSGPEGTLHTVLTAGDPGYSVGLVSSLYICHVFLLVENNYF